MNYSLQYICILQTFYALFSKFLFTTDLTREHGTPADNSGNVQTNDMFGDIPDKTKGVAHALMELAWKQEIHTLFTVQGEHRNDIVHFFYKFCVQNIVGKRAWSKKIDRMELGRVCTFSDEAFAMVVVESNVGKWMDEVRYPSLRVEERRRSIYTEPDGREKKWTDDGLERFVELCNHCRDFRIDPNNAERWSEIQAIVKGHERSGNRKRRRGLVETDEEVMDRRRNMEAILFGLANGGPTVQIPDTAVDQTEIHQL